jgi:vacuolar-type H+-ATPase subunit H
MKRFLKITGIVLLFLFLIILIAPYFLKDKIFELIRQEANNSLKGELVIEDFDLSLISDFPNLSLELKNLKYTGSEPFEGTDLFQIGKINVEIDLFSAISGNTYQVDAIEIFDPSVQVKVLRNGIANYDIVKPSEEEPIDANQESESEAFNLKLKHFGIQRLNLVYDDRSSNMHFEVHNLNHDLSGNFSDELVDLKTSTVWDAMTIALEGITYLNQVHGSSDFDMSYYFEDSHIALGENHVDLNNLILQFQGNLKMMENGYDMDISFQSVESTFKNLMSLIPAVYKSDMAGIKASGKFDVAGSVIGQYIETSDELPSFNIALNVDNGSFAYSDLPASLEKVGLDLKIDHPGGPSNNVEIDLKKLYFEAADDPFEARLQIKDPMTNPLVDGAFEGEINLQKWNSIIPMDEPLEGQIIAHALFAGRQSDFENNNLGKVKAEGVIQLNDFHYIYADYNLPVTVKRMKVELAPNKFNLPYLEAKTLHSDYQAQGEVTNAFSWYLSDAPLKGSFSMNSKKIDLNEFIGDSVDPASDSTSENDEEYVYEVIRVPENLDFDMQVSVQELLYDDLTFNDVQGVAQVKEGVVYLNPLSMGFEGGTFGLSGNYDTREELPQTDLNFTIGSLPMVSALNLSMVSAYLPIAKNIVGNMNAGLNLSTQIGEDMMPVLSSISGSGNLNTKGLSYSSNILKEVNRFFKGDDLTKVKFDEPNLSFEINDGTLRVKPIKLKLGNQQFTFSGIHNLEQELNYELTTKVDISKMNLPPELELLKLTSGASIDLKLLVGGNMENPTITPKFGDIAIGNVGREVVETVKDTVKKVVKQKGKEEAEKILAQAQAQADAIMSEARNQAATVKFEAKKQADQFKAQAETEANKLVEQAKDPLAKLAAKEAAKQVLKEANKQIDQLNVEANKQADQIIAEAQKQSDEVLADAKQRADALTE